MAHDSTEPVAFEAPERDLDLPPEHSPDWLSEGGEPPRRKAALPLPFEWEGDWLGLRHLKAGKVTRKANLNPPDYDGLSADAIERRHAYGTAPLRPPERVEIKCETFAPTIWHYTLPTKLCCERRDPVKASSAEISVQDRSLDAAPTFLVIRKQRFECRNCRKRFFEVLPDVNDAQGVKQRGKKKSESKLVAEKKDKDTGIKHKVTKRLRRDIALAAVKYTAAEAAQLLHVHIGIVDRVYADYRDVVTANHKYHLPRKLGIDGTFLLGKARCVIADVENNRILDILPHDDSPAVFQHIAQTFSIAERETVEVFVHDMAKMYGWIQTLFPNATRVIDRYHIVSLIQEYTDAARVEITNSMDKPSQKMLRKNVWLFKGPRYSLNASERLEYDKITAANQRLFHVMQSRKLFEEIFKEEDHSAALWRYQLWVDYIHEGRTCKHPETGEPMSYSLLPWFGSLHNTIEGLKTPIFAGFVKKYRYTTAFVEGMNRRIQEINRDANGLSFKSLRAKALLRYGEYHTQADLVSFSLKLFPIGITPESYSLGSEEFDVFEKLLEQCHPRGHRRIANLHPLIYAILWRTMNGYAWADLEPHFGNSTTAARTFYRWAQIGVWERLALAADEWRERLDLPPLQHRPKLQVRNVWWHANPVIQQAAEYVLMLPGLLIMIAEREQELMTEERVWTGFTPDDLYAASH